MKAELNIMSDRDLTIAQHVLAYSPEYADTCVAMEPSMLCDLLNSPSIVDVVKSQDVVTDIDFMRIVDVGTSGKRLSYSLNKIGYAGFEKHANAVDNKLFYFTTFLSMMAFIMKTYFPPKTGVGSPC